MPVGALDPWNVVTAVGTGIAAVAAIGSAFVAWRAQRGARQSEAETLKLRGQAAEAAQRASDAAERSAEAVGDIARTMRGPAWHPVRSGDILRLRNASGEAATGVRVLVNDEVELVEPGPVADGAALGDVFVTRSMAERDPTEVVVMWDQGRAPCVVPVPPRPRSGVVW